MASQACFAKRLFLERTEQEKHYVLVLVAVGVVVLFKSIIFYSVFLTCGEICIHIDPNLFFNFCTFQAVSVVSQHFPELSQYVKEQIYLLKEEIACLEKVSVKLETEMKLAMKTKGQ